MQTSTLRRIGDIVILIVAAALLLVAQSAYWLNHTVFDKQAFTSIVTPIVNSDATRSAVATTIVNEAFADRPLINRLIGNNVTALVSGLLGTDLAVQMTSAVISKSYDYLTTPDPQPVTLDLIAIKAPLEKITELLESRGRDVAINPDNIPDSITLLDPSSLPNTYGYSVFLLWFGPLCWIGFVLFSILYIYLGRRIYPRRVYILGGIIIVASCIGLLVGPLLPPPISAQVPIPELRSTVQTLIESLLAPFTQQMITAVILTAIVLIIFYCRFAILRGIRWLTEKAADSVSTAKKPTPKGKK